MADSRPNNSPFQDLFDEIFRLPSMIEGGIGRNRDIDVYETADDVVVRMTAPGVRPEDINVSVTGDTLTVSGEVKEESEVSNRNFYQRQLRYGRFSQSIILPSQVKSDRAEATFANGILTLKFPKSEEAKPRQIKIKVEDKPKKDS
jgi:HSP20 family protein